jgi:hypothetical protein
MEPKWSIQAGFEPVRVLAQDVAKSASASGVYGAEFVSLPLHLSNVIERLIVQSKDGKAFCLSCASEFTWNLEGHKHFCVVGHAMRALQAICEQLKTAERNSAEVTADAVPVGGPASVARVLKCGFTPCLEWTLESGDVRSVFMPYVDEVELLAAMINFCAGIPLAVLRLRGAREAALKAVGVNVTKGRGVDALFGAKADAR